MSFEDCVVIRICCKRKKNSVRLINILVVYIITSEYLPLKCDDGRPLHSQVDESSFQKINIYFIFGTIATDGQTAHPPRHSPAP